MINEPQWIRRKYDAKYRLLFNRLIDTFLMIRDYKGIDKNEQFVEVLDTSIKELHELKRIVIFYKNNGGTP